VAQLNSRILTLFLVADAHVVTLVIIHQRGVHGSGKAASGKFHRCPDVEQRAVVKE
jgi:hypothetical protein